MIGPEQQQEGEEMKASAIITMADELCPNVFSTAVKVMELNRIENRVRLDVLLQDPEDVDQIAAAALTTTDMALGDNYQDVYVLWMICMYYYHMGEYEEYQNKKAMFEGAWTRLNRDECYRHHEGTGGPEYPRIRYAAGEGF